MAARGEGPRFVKVHEGDTDMNFMNFLRLNARTIAFPMVVLMLALCVPMGVAQAALVGTDQVITRTEIDNDRARVAAFLAREDVRRQIESMGVDPDEAAARVDGLSDAEVQQIAARIDTLPAGQDALGTILVILLVVFLVLIITDILGVTDIFPFIKKPVR